MAQIFISYSRSDRPFLDDFVPLIRKVYGNDCLWFDDDIHGGADWWQMILNEVAKCDLFVYLISNESLESPYCQAELREALRLNKQVLPVIVRRLKPPYPGDIDPDLAGILQKTQYVDLSGGFKNPTLTAGLYAAINRLTQQMPGQHIPPQWAQPIRQPLVSDKKPPWFARPGIVAAGLIGLGGVISLICLMALILTALSQGNLSTATPDTEPTTVIALQSAATATPESRSTSPPTHSVVPTFTLTDTVALLPTPTDLLLASPTGSTPRVTARLDANVRSGDDTVYPRVGFLRDGESAQIIGISSFNSGWYLIQLDDGTEGWIAPSVVQVEGDLSNMPPIVPPPPPTSFVTSTITPTTAPASDPEERAFIPVEQNSDWTPYIQDFDGVEMALVPMGCFMMGSEVGEDDEKPVHQQCFLEPFWIDKYEVNNADFARFLIERGNASAEGGEYLDADDDQARIEGQANGWTVVAGYEQHPVTEVTWFAAYDYCAWRGDRLPTEREWEYAASGPSNWVYPWGDDWNTNNAVWANNHPSITNTAIIGGIPVGASWAGALDMSGNVWEWVSSLYADYPYDVSYENSSDVDHMRVLRGGSWFDGKYGLRAADRYGINPVLADLNFGFRCARDYES